MSLGVGVGLNAEETGESDEDRMLETHRSFISLLCRDPEMESGSLQVTRLAPPERTFVRRAEVSLGRDVAV